MAINVDFKAAVDKKDIQLTRIMLKDSMVIDPTFSEFDTLTKYAEANLPDLYDEHDGEEFDLDKANWTKDYLNKQMINVVFNYSEERISFLKELCTYCYADRIKELKAAQPTTEPRSGQGSPSGNSVPHSTPHCSSSTVSKKQIGTGVLIGGGVLAAVGIACSEAVVVVAGAAVAVAGGVMIATDK